MDIENFGKREEKKEESAMDKFKADLKFAKEHCMATTYADDAILELEKRITELEKKVNES